MSAPWRRASAPSPYIDIVGRPWSDEHLDKILSDPGALRSVEAAAEAGLSADGSSCSFADVRAWAVARYPRAEVVALLLVLVAHFLHSEAWAAASARGSK